MPADAQTLSVKNAIDELPRLAKFVDSFCAPLALAPSDLPALHLALEEVVTNVIRHGYTDGKPHIFTVTLAAPSANRIIAVVEDDAPAYDPLARAEVDITVPLAERSIGGLGVHLVKKLMSAARYDRRDGKNILTLERALGRTS